ncbi:ankyrin [Wilcoxina mikolae CBS 423.85]|nr:ankyrin [Wilcoxina mikolae CBS 423.85]
MYGPTHPHSLPTSFIYSVPSMFLLPSEPIPTSSIRRYCQAESEMDPLSPAASVVAIITAALNSAKFIHQIIRSIKDGPHHILELSAKLSDLQGILRQLQSFDRSGNAFDELRQFMAPCANDLANFERKLAKLNDIPGEGRWAKIRRGVGIMLREDDFLSMNRKITHYIDILTVQVGMFGAVQLDHGAVLGFLETKVAEIDDQLIQQSAVANRHSDTLSDIARCSTTHLNQSQELHQETQRDVRTVADKVDKLVNMSTNQFHTIVDLLQQLQKAQSTRKNNNTGHPDHLDSALLPALRIGRQKTQFEPESTSRSKNTEASESINRLFGLAENSAITIYSMEAQSIIKDIENILDIAFKDACFGLQSGHQKRKYENVGFDNEWDICHFKRMRGLLGSAPAVDLNQNERIQLTLPPGSRFHNKYTFKTIEIGGWSLSILARDRRRGKQHAEPADHENTIFTGTLTITPNGNATDGNSRLRLTASLQQKVECNGYYSLKPTLSFSAVLPLNSKVFELAKNGDVQGLLRLLSERKASLSDSDTAGRQLLHYACFGGKPTMCKFLLENGADPDYIAIPYKSVRLYAPLMHSFGHQTGDEGALEGQRLLLDAGADPLLRVGSHKNALENALVFGSKDFLQLIIQRGNTFFDINEPLDQCNHSPLLYTAWWILNEDALTENLNLLIKNGADINATNRHGNTILHLFLEDPELRARNSYEVNRWQRVLIAVLTSAIETGFNLAAKNHAGFTASDYAYQWHVGKEWEEALTVCGLYAAEICGPHYQNYIDTELAGGVHSYSPNYQFPELGVRSAHQGSRVRRKYELCEHCEQHMVRQDYREQDHRELDDAIQWRAPRKVWRPPIQDLRNVQIFE